MADNTPLENEVAEMLVSTLNLEIKPSEIAAEEPLFGEGLGLDSIDALEISLAISQNYGIKLSTETDNIAEIFTSLKSLSAYISDNK